MVDSTSEEIAAAKVDVKYLQTTQKRRIAKMRIEGYRLWRIAGEYRISILAVRMVLCQQGVKASLKQVQFVDIKPAGVEVVRKQYGTSDRTIRTWCVSRRVT